MLNDLSVSVLCVEFISVVLVFCVCCSCFFFKQKTAYEVLISDWSSDVCSSVLCNIVNLDNGRCDKCAIARIVAELDLLNNMASSAHFLDIPLNLLPRVLRNHRPDIDGEPVGLADAELPHGTLEHCERALGNVVLEAKTSQRRTTRAGNVNKTESQARRERE